MNEIKYKVWYILLENVNYTAENIFNISHNIALESFHKEHDEIKKLWDNDKNIVEIRMMYNMYFLEKLESFLITNGILFNWIIYQNEYIGIRIHPTTINFNGLLIDCMTLDEFAKHRDYMYIKEKN
jgi:hypothetical protein